MTAVASAELAAIRIDDVLRNARARGASDVHLATDARPAIRVDGRLITLEGDPVRADALEAFVRRLLGSAQSARLEAHGTADAILHGESAGTARVHVFHAAGGLRVAVRLLPATVPLLAELELPAALHAACARSQGLVLLTGPTGSGKSTALAAAIDHINRTAARHIITIEDPIEFVHRSQRSLVAQIGVGREIADYPAGVASALRADPDVLLIGEMRDRTTMAAALTAAETGHLVFSTLHTNDAPQSVDRILDAFGADAAVQVRAQLALVLSAVISLRLVPQRGGRGRCAAAEVLVATDAVRTLVREGKGHQLRNVMLTGRASGMQTLEADLSALVARGRIDRDAAVAAANHPADLRLAEQSA